VEKIRNNFNEIRRSVISIFHADDGVDHPFYLYFGQKFWRFIQNLDVNPRYVEWPFIESLLRELNIIVDTYNRHVDLYLSGEGHQGEIDLLSASMVDHVDWETIHDLISEIHNQLCSLAVILRNVILYPLRLKTVTLEQWEARYRQENNDYYSDFE